MQPISKSYLRSLYSTYNNNKLTIKLKFAFIGIQTGLQTFGKRVDRGEQTSSRVSYVLMSAFFKLSIILCGFAHGLALRTLQTESSNGLGSGELGGHSENEIKSGKVFEQNFCT